MQITNKKITKAAVDKLKNKCSSNNIINSLTQSNVLAKNVLHSLLSQGLPALVAFASIPLLIDALGANGFGMLTLAWMITGYFSIFDLGVGRAMTKMISDKLGSSKNSEIPELIWSALFLTVATGSLGSLMLYFATPYLVTEIFKIPFSSLYQTQQTIYVLALSIPIIISSGLLRGILEAYQRFDLISTIRVPFGILTYLGPLFVLQFSHSLFYIVCSIVLSRTLEWALSMKMCFHVVSGLKDHITISFYYCKKLINFGSWMTVSNVVSPIMVYFDRFLIGYLITASAVAYFSTPYEIISRLMIIPGAFAGVLFPAFSMTIAQDPRRATDLFRKGLKYTYVAIYPLSLLFVICGQEILDLWLGREFSENSTAVFQLLAIGAVFSGQAYTPFAFIHATGRADLTAKLHLSEAPIYMVLMWFLITNYGIVGAAVGWTIRSLVDTVVLCIMASNFLPQRLISSEAVAFYIFSILLLLCIVIIPVKQEYKILFTLIVIGLFFIVFWNKFMTFDERCAILKINKIFRA